ncbi:M48 family metallopeptidase [Pseudomonas sp. PSPC2-3]|uniref:M48 metallopeptidase family protein n=1 Tax=Pseudomonas sp. PSPC2-3 TaxID=2804561 RepID=UPI003CF6A65C
MRLIASVIDFFLKKYQVVVVALNDVSEAFQFFDSQNARGRDLNTQLLHIGVAGHCVDVYALEQVAVILAEVACRNPFRPRLCENALNTSKTESREASLWNQQAKARVALVKKPKDLLEYVIVHEMIHLLEPTHNERFIAILGEHFPT